MLLRGEFCGHTRKCRLMPDYLFFVSGATAQPGPGPPYFQISRSRTVGRTPLHE
jgi:hypothetical protein